MRLDIISDCDNLLPVIKIRDQAEIAPEHSKNAELATSP
ncbi:MAG: hypothetical protein UW19_C0024G0007 [Candidatus Moranbacteria bacterium GW2011_GWF2_44_10]|nr:MAG: hypothetical protein UW19_C0024G0007 [Candidatus Moranbacteria bacterium GW2011_GWF2_44_10]